MVGADFDSLYGHWSTSGFTYWALARSLWQPTAFNRTTALVYWAEKAFGGQAGDPTSAAAAGSDYINFWERWTARTFTNATVRAMQNAGPGKLGRLTVTPAVYTQSVLHQGSALLRRVEQRCGSYRGCSARVEFIRSGLLHANLTAAAITAVARHTGFPWYASSCFGGNRACLVDAVLPAASALLHLRRKIAPTGAINILDVASTEGPVPGHDITGQWLAHAADVLTTASAGLIVTPSVLLPTVSWTLVLDVDGVGLAQRWGSWNASAVASRARSDASAGAAAIGQPWNASKPALAWSAAHANRTYVGVAWYFVACAGWPWASEGRPPRLLATAAVGGSASAWLGGAALPRAATGVGGATAFRLGGAAACAEGGTLAVRCDGRGRGAAAGLSSPLWVV